MLCICLQAIPSKYALSLAINNTLIVLLAFERSELDKKYPLDGNQSPVSYQKNKNPDALTA